METLPPIGIVIPGYGHPQFLAEAIISACEQDTERELHVVVVDDGCKFPETRAVVSHLLPKYAGHLHYIRQKNTRLPGARNTGIRFLLNLLPDIDAVYFLDADNRISPYSIEAYRRTLGDDRSVGWAYPDISFFGLSRGENGFDTREPAPEYSRLKHLLGNVSEAGSMVRAEMLRAGVMFDETMTSGFEDWDFWFSALEAGYIGKRCVNSGFLYRRRPESMLADSRRMSDALVAKMRNTHKDLFDPQNVMFLEHVEAPYFAVQLVDNPDEVLLMSDPLMPSEKIASQEFTARFHAWANITREYFFPPILLIMPSETWEEIRESTLYSRWIFWQLRERASEFLYIQAENNTQLRMQFFPDFMLKTKDKVQIFAVRTDAIRKLADPVMGANYQTEKPTFAAVTFPAVENAEGAGLSNNQAICLSAKIGKKELDKAFEKLLSKLSPVPQYARHQTRMYAGPAAVRVREDLVRDICAMEGREPYPACRKVERTLVAVKATFLMNEASRNKVCELLETLNSSKHETCLLIEKSGPVDLTECVSAEWEHLVSSIIPYSITGSGGEYRMYLGRRISSELTYVAPDDIAIFARQCTRVIGCGAVATLEAFGEARLHGADGYVLLEKEFVSSDMEATMHLSKLLAYEHAIVRLVTNENTYETSLTAEGFPPSKFQRKSDFYKEIKSHKA